MMKLATAFAATIAVVTATIDHVTASPTSAIASNVSSGSASASSADDTNDAGFVESGYQIADVSGAQACGGEGFNYSRYWVGPMPDGDATKLNCVSGYRCEAEGSNPIFWCKQYALPLNAKCGGYLFYTLFKCIDGTVAPSTRFATNHAASRSTTRRMPKQLILTISIETKPKI